MKVELEFAELQSPLFFKSMNLGVKLPKPDHRSKMVMEWDTDKDKLYIWYNGNVAVVPMANVICCVPKRAQDLSALGVTEPVIMPSLPPQTPVLVKGKIKAQVSTPTSHVFDEPK